jgi:hypothetical protein
MNPTKKVINLNTGPKITKKAIPTILYARQCIRLSTQCICLCILWMGHMHRPKGEAILATGDVRTHAR